MRVNRLVDIDCIRTHLNRKSNFANLVTRMGADHATAQYLAVPMRLGDVIKQQLGHTFIATIGNVAA